MNDIALSISIPEETLKQLEQIALDIHPLGGFSISDVIVQLAAAEASKMRAAVIFGAPFYVYLMKKAQNGHLKIGVSRDPETRRDCLKHHHYSDFEIVNMSNGMSRQRALRCEGFLLHALREFHVEETAVDRNGREMRCPDGYTEFFKPEALKLALRSMEKIDEHERHL